ncbi:hypothetical protein FRC12_000581 [Ceratobasidium sp. 428]|nr:hypothetical protein FRC12_000581 [Ceratobasidium sp. 428]
MNESNIDSSDKAASKHTISTTTEYQSSVITSPTLTNSDITDITDINGSDQGEHNACEDTGTQESQEDVHQPDDAPPQPDDMVRARGRPNSLVVPGRTPQSPERPNNQEMENRGSNPCVAQAHAPAGPGVAGDGILPVYRPGTPPILPPGDD